MWWPEDLATAKPWEAQYWKLLTRIGNLEGQVDTAFGGALHGRGREAAVRLRHDRELVALEGSVGEYVVM